MHTAEPLVSKTSSYDAEMVTEMLKRYKLPSIAYKMMQTY
jgi:hypothetical protein